jgi:hypothetical protein
MKKKKVIQAGFFHVPVALKPFEYSSIQLAEVCLGGIIMLIRALVVRFRGAAFQTHLNQAKEVLNFSIIQQTPVNFEYNSKLHL